MTDLREDITGRLISNVVHGKVTKNSHNVEYVLKHSLKK